MRLRRLVGGYLLLSALGWLGIYAWVRLPSAPPPLPARTRTQVVAWLRAALSGRPLPPALLSNDPALGRPAPLPAFVTVYVDGQIAARRQATGSTLAAALAAAAPPPLDEARAHRARIKLDLVTAAGRVVSRVPLLFAFGVRPGEDGLVLHFGDRAEWFLPDDLVADEVLTGLAPFAFMEFEFGVDVPRLVRLGASRVGASRDSWGRTPHRWERLQVESFIESADQTAALEVWRAGTPGPAPTRAALHAAALAGGRYLVDKLRPDGSFDYEYDTASDRGRRGDYALPRHFGAAMYLAQLFRVTSDPSFAVAADRAFRYFEPHAAEVFESTGSAALATLALCEYRAGGDLRYDATLRRLGDYLLSMQRPAGDFDHVVEDRAAKLFYFDGEAAFALVRLAAAFPDDPRYAAAARRALDWLVGPAYGHFAGGFYFGEDHWTCMAAEAAWPRIDDARYQRFCDDYAAFLRRAQFAPGEGPPDFTGAYGFSPFFPPHATPAASRTEAMVSAYELSRHRGHPQEATRVQVVRALGYLLAQQIRPDSSWLMAQPERALGGWMQSPLRRFVRIDFVQHAGDALLRGEAVVDR
jgi:hypothetical protein